MNSPKNRCARCGAPLPADAAENSCQKCLLEAGLISVTDFDSGDFAETLPASDEQRSNSAGSSSKSSSDARHLSGRLAYQNLEAVHDWSGGTVYRAFHAGLERYVRLRVLDPSADEESRDDFLQRAQSLSQLDHPHIVATLEAGVDRGGAYVAEEWVEGRPVEGFGPRAPRERWAEGMFPNVRLIRIMRDAAGGLQAMHQIGLTHQRFNPDSLLIDSGDMVKLVDLGEASDVSDDRYALPATVAQTFGAVDKPRTDLFRFGATFCFLTTGKLPVEVDSTLDFRNIYRRIKRLNPGLRRDVCRVIASCLHFNKQGGNPRPEVEKNPFGMQRNSHSEGYQSASEIVEDLQRILQTDAQRISWRLRSYSGYLELFLAFLIAALIQTTVARRYGEEIGDIPVSTAALAVMLPIFYIATFEAMFGWTLVRRFFGMRLIDHAGEPAAWWRRFSRAFQKCVLLILLVLLPAMLMPAAAMAGLSPLISVPLLLVLTLVLPPLGMYGPSYWIPSRWTSYDLSAGATWGEVTSNLINQSTESAAMPADAVQRTQTGKLDHYDLYGLIGSGGMGQVYLGHDRVLGRNVAIKLLSRSLGDNPMLLERFQREARLAAKVSHPGVAKVFGNGFTDHNPYIAMEYVPGRNLQQLIRERGGLPLGTAWDYALQAAEALQAANRSGVVHRDVKPANLMITENGQVKVTDFGVSRMLDIESGVTHHGTIVGTPAYMAPEQAMGKQVDCRSDMYSLGMTLYHMLAGHPPFSAESAVVMLSKQMSENPPSLMGKVDQLTTDQAAVLERMIAKKPTDRYSTYDELIHDLRCCAPGVDRLASPYKRIAAETCNWAVGYLFFTMAMFLVFLVGRQFGLTSRGGTLVVGGLCTVLYGAFVGVYIVGIAFSGRTPGKLLLGLRVVGKEGRSVGFTRSLIRFIVAYPVLAIYVPRILYYIIARAPGGSLEQMFMSGIFVVQGLLALVSLYLMWMQSNRRALHDLAAGTTVVRDPR